VTAPQAAPAEPAEAVAEEPDNSPAWVIATEEFLAPFASVVLLFYLVGDISLVVMATTLLLAFWGGRFSLSWRFIAAAALCFYIADFSACLFAIGAALEYDLSTRSRRTSRRRG
jgi:peptidoglycan/LPS O-acetylase OafA/YrhL